ncbi:MAG TPA: GMC family oxidoreductase N-terminal domain-containing protein, partial [Gaiellales bacterium]|nr:GMC family oxidoreductase N-terminal domain-containing protein [Gaiellales bacterium]
MSSNDLGVFDYVVVGGGTAGAIVAARLSQDPGVSVCLVEAGPSDVGRDDVLQLRRWLSLLEGPLDLGYTTTLQPRGNAHILHSRACVLGGCSSHNTQIYFKPLPGDWRDWVDRGAAGWGPEAMEPYYERLLTRHQLVADGDRNALLHDWVPAAAKAAGVPANPDWNAAPFRDGAGFLDIGYDPGTGVRSSSSVAYLHPIMDCRANLTLMLGTWVRRVDLEGTRAVSVTV